MRHDNENAGQTLTRGGSQRRSGRVAPRGKKTNSILLVPSCPEPFEPLDGLQRLKRACDNLLPKSYMSPGPPEKKACTRLFERSHMKAGKILRMGLGVSENRGPSNVRLPGPQVGSRLSCKAIYLLRTRFGPIAPCQIVPKEQAHQGPSKGKYQVKCVSSWTCDFGPFAVGSDQCPASPNATVGELPADRARGLFGKQGQPKGDP